MSSNGRHLASRSARPTAAAPVSDAEHVRDELLQLLLTVQASACSCPSSAPACAGVEPASDVLRGWSRRASPTRHRAAGASPDGGMIDVTFDDAVAMLEVTVLSAGRPIRGRQVPEDRAMTAVISRDPDDRADA
jgi:hypothetical protein